jgi:O-Antigen ligase
MTRVGGWTVSDLLFLLSGAAVLIQLLNQDERYLTPRRYRSGSQLAVAGLLLIVTGATLSSFGSWSPLSSMMVVARLIWTTLIWFWVLRSVCRDRDAFNALMWAWRCTILISSVIALLGEYVGIRFNTQDFGQGRQAGLTFHPGELMNFLIAGFFLFVIPVFVPGRPTTHRFSTGWWLAGTAVVMLAIFSTGSTSAILAVSAGVLVVIAVTLYSGRSGLGRRRSPLVTLSVLALMAVSFMVLMSSDLAIAERLTSYGEGSGNLGASVDTRTETNEAILADFDKFLLVGVGPTFFGGAAESLVGGSGGSGTEYGNIHNMHLKLLYESGLPALVGLWLIIYTVGRQAYRLVVVNRGTELYQSSLILLGTFVAVNVSAMFGPTAYARHFWLPFAMIGCLWSVRRRELDEAAATRQAAMPTTTERRWRPAAPARAR